MDISVVPIMYSVCDIVQMILSVGMSMWGLLGLPFISAQIYQCHNFIIFDIFDGDDEENGLINYQFVMSLIGAIVDETGFYGSKPIDTFTITYFLFMP